MSVLDMARDYQGITGHKNINYRTGFATKENKKVFTFYNTWQKMKGRCLRQTDPKYHRYGGRGIKICPEWLDIANFAEWALNNGWQKGLSIDRIDNDGDYEPNNCRWVTVSENSRNKRTTKISLMQANLIRERLTAGEDERLLAKEYGVVHGTIWFIKMNYTHMPEGMCTKALKKRRVKDA